MKRIFIKFLKDNGAYYKYVAALARHSKELKVATDTISKVCDRNAYYNYFLTFIWSDTVDGRSYWNELDMKWTNQCLERA